ncbi:MAG: CopG family antitoxin [Candidatus Poribacteria bacterium]
MKIITKILQTDSIQELAHFWDTHDLTDFEDELEKVSENVFEHQTEIKIQLQSEDIEAIMALAKAKGISYDVLIREWVLERIHPL